MDKRAWGGRPGSGRGAVAVKVLSEVDAMETAAACCGFRRASYRRSLGKYQYRSMAAAASYLLAVSKRMK
ncbi:MAG: hypothetical protein ACKVOF_01845 [Pseudohongiellaceae bacterium]